MPSGLPLLPCRQAGSLLLATAVLLALVPEPAPAARWEKLIPSGPGESAFDMDSVRPAAFGRLGVWLKSTPSGKAQRRAAAAEYGITSYRWHLELYEINCGEESAVLVRRDVMGNNGKRLLRQEVGGKAEAIVPGSELDQVAQRICPAVEESSENEPDTTIGDTAAADVKISSDTGMTPQARQRIADAVKRTEAEPSNPASWSELGNAYFDTDMPREAIEAYDRSLALKPNNADVLNDQGAMFRQMGNLTRALKNFQMALAIDQNNLESLYNMGYMYAFDLHDFERARTIWQRYLVLDRSSETARQVQSFITLYSH